MQSFTDSGLRIGRHAILWLAGPFVFLVRGQSVALAPPEHCAAALDLVAVAILRRRPDLTVGTLLTALQFVAIVVALGCVAEWCDWLTGRVSVAVATVVTLGVSPAFTPLLSLPTYAVAIGAAASIARVLTATGNQRSATGPAFVAIVLILAAAVVPAWWMACAVTAAAIASQAFERSNGPKAMVSGMAAAGLAGLASLAMLRATYAASLDSRPWYACAVPAVNVFSSTAEQIGEAARLLGPIGVALAALGIAAQPLRGRFGRALAIAFVIALASIAESSGRTGATGAAMVVALWSLAALGIAEIAAMMQQRRGGAVAVAILLVALPVLEAARVRGDERDDIVRPDSQERASLGSITTMLNLAPSGAQFVEEDASIHLLLKAAIAGGRRATKPFAVIGADRERVGRALHDGPVLAFPRGQQLESVRGFEISPVGEQGLRGVARVAAERSCHELGTTWTDLSAEGAHGRIAVVAASERSAGPVTLYFGGPTEYLPGPDGWPSRVVLAGFEVRAFDRSNDADAARLDAEAQETAPAAPVFREPFVTRLFVRRTPQSALELPVILGPPRSSGIGRLRDDAPAGDRIAVCDAPPVNISRF